MTIAATTSLPNALVAGTTSAPVAQPGFGEAVNALLAAASTGVPTSVPVATGAALPQPSPALAALPLAADPAVTAETSSTPAPPVALGVAAPTVPADGPAALPVPAASSAPLAPRGPAHGRATATDAASLVPADIAAEHPPTVLAGLESDQPLAAPPARDPGQPATRLPSPASANAAKPKGTAPAAQPGVATTPAQVGAPSAGITVEGPAAQPGAAEPERPQDTDAPDDEEAATSQDPAPAQPFGMASLAPLAAPFHGLKAAMPVTVAAESLTPVAVADPRGTSTDAAVSESVAAAPALPDGFTERLAATASAPAIPAADAGPAAPSSIAQALAQPVQASAPASPASPVAHHQPTVTAQAGQIGREMGVAIAHRVHDGGNELTVRLNPVEMGRIEVKLAFDHGGTLRATVAAESPAALDLLRRDSADLGRALSDAGVRADAQSFRFDSGGGGGAGARDQSGARQQAGAQRNAGRFYADEATAADPPTYRGLRTSGRVDLTA